MEPSTHDFEKLGSFYLGRKRDLIAGQTTTEPLLYDSRDLTTHAVVVGMTGSGKTGLCIGLLEEAGIDRIPAIVIDPKGDIANLLLTFPELSPEDFLPWVDPGQASREGKTCEEFAASESEKWRKGLGKWGQDGERIRRLRDTVEMRVYTPGSTAGRPMTILKSFTAPCREVMEDSDLLRERISSAASGLLALLGIDADPIRSREHILISQILGRAWNAGEDLDLGKLIGQIQTPPFQSVGIMEMDTFFPPRDRMELAMTLNNLLASPSFANWMEGEPLSVKNLLHTSGGKPCISIISIAQLNDAERMFFVTILLNEVLAWMRTQAGTSSLRAILYMDEVFGYFPPVKNPPSKLPMMTLLKQARAFGLGVVLATQNPVDLDYKGLSNTGTWFLGRLQTERDKARVLEGLEGAAAQTGSTFDKSGMDRILSGLGSRVFLMNNVHDDEPVVFETRWAMSYLRGPMTRSQIQQLLPAGSRSSPDIRNQAGEAGQEDFPGGDTGQSIRPDDAGKLPANVGFEPEKAASDLRLSIPTAIPQRFVEVNLRVRPNEKLVYHPMLFGRGRLHFVKSTFGIDFWEERCFIRKADPEPLPGELWDEAEVIAEQPDWSDEPEPSAEFGSLPGCLQEIKNYRTWQQELKEFLYRGQSLRLYQFAPLKLTSEAGETEGEFRVRLETAVSELRDRETEKLRQKFATRFQAMRDQIKRAEAKLEKEQADYRSRQLESALSVGGSLLNALMGRRRSRASAVTAVGRATRERQDVLNAEESMEALQAKYADLDREFSDAMAKVSEKVNVMEVALDTVEIPPRKSDLAVEELVVAWFPSIIDSNGREHRAWG